MIYTLYIVVAQNIDSYDMQELSQISMFLANYQITEYVPIEFWSVNMDKALKKHMVTFDKYKN